MSVATRLRSVPVSLGKGSWRSFSGAQRLSAWSRCCWSRRRFWPLKTRSRRFLSPIGTSSRRRSLSGRGPLFTRRLSEIHRDPLVGTDIDLPVFVQVLGLDMDHVRETLVRFERRCDELANFSGLLGGLIVKGY